MIIGAGHNGLVAAALLARHGLDVLVLERRERPGGAAATEELVPGFRFSTCAYAVHMLHEQVVAAAGIDLAPVLLRPAPPRTAVLPDGSVFRARDDDETAERLGPDGSAFLAWQQEWRAVARAVDAHLLGEPPSTDELAAAGGDVVRRFARTSYDDLLAERFVSDAARTLLGPVLPCDPTLPGSALAYAYFRTDELRAPECQGVPQGGMGALAEAFAAAATRAGAEVVLGEPAAAIVVEHGRATGVELRDGERVSARWVLSNADPKRTFLGLVPPEELPARLARSIGALVTTPPAAKLHLALAEAPDVSRLTDDASSLGLVHVYSEHAAPPLELQLPTLADAALAPAGAHCLSIYALDARTFSLDPVARAIPNLPEITIEGVLLGPAELEDRLGLPGGCIHHLAHVPSQSYLARGGPRTPIPGLLLCGAGIHPGGEISGVPGWNAAHTVTAST